MQNFKHKVQSQSGVSMLMALFLLLVVTVVSVVILVSATSAAHQVRDNRAAQQAYLTVSSAADLLVQAFAKQSYTYTLTTYTRSDDHKITRTDDKESTSESVLQKTLLAASQAVRLHDDKTPSERVFSRSAKLSLTSAEEKMQPVQAEFRLSCQRSGSESRYEMLVRLSLADTVETEPGYRMELRIPISKTQRVESRGNIPGETAEGMPITWEVTDSITEVVWQQARITKGWQDAKA
jgi:hypothetical protein